MELEALRQHPLQLQLVDELGEADEERRGAVAVADLAQARMLGAQARHVALEDRAAPDALRERRERSHAGTGSEK